MPIPSVHDMLEGEIMEQPEFTLIPEGDYNGVITEAVISTDKNGEAFLKVEVTLHDDEFQGRKVRRNWVSLAPDYLAQQGNGRQLAKSVNPLSPIDRELPGDAALAQAAMSTPVSVGIGHENFQEKDATGTYVDAFNDDGSHKLRASVRSFAPAPEDFVASIELEAAGVDEDLPF